jgi:hypothetical protein
MKSSSFSRDAPLTSCSYVDRPTAVLKHLISSGNNVPAYMGVDYNTSITDMTQGRASVRIESKKNFTHGLIIPDIGHMPGGICGTWPAREFTASIRVSDNEVMLNVVG